MKLSALAAALFLLTTAPLRGQAPLSPVRAEQLDTPSIGLVSVHADAEGRRGLCEELIRLAAGERGLLVVPEEARLRCAGRLTDRFELHAQKSLERPLDIVCRLARQPLALVFHGMRAFALRRSAPPSPPLELQLTLQRLGVKTFGGVLEAMGFADVEVYSGASSVASIGVHELSIACLRPDAG